MFFTGTKGRIKYNRMFVIERFVSRCFPRKLRVSLKKVVWTVLTYFVANKLKQFLLHVIFTFPNSQKKEQTTVKVCLMFVVLRSFHCFFIDHKIFSFFLEKFIFSCSFFLCTALGSWWKNCHHCHVENLTSILVFIVYLKLIDSAHIFVLRNSVRTHWNLLETDCNSSEKQVVFFHSWERRL